MEHGPRAEDNTREVGRAPEQEVAKQVGPGEEHGIGDPAPPAGQGGEEVEMEGDMIKVGRCLRGLMRLDNIVSSDPMEPYEGDSWWSRVGTNTKYGAEVGDDRGMQGFLAGSQTWYHPQGECEASAARSAVEAVNATRVDTRVVLLMSETGWEKVRGEIKAEGRVDVLPGQCVKEETTTANIYTAATIVKTVQRGEDGRWTVVVIDNMMEGVDVGQPQSKNGWPEGMSYHREGERGCDGSRRHTVRRRRYPPQLRPSLIWFRTDLAAGEKEQGDEQTGAGRAHRAMMEHNKILGMLGVLPKGIRGHLRAMGHTKEETSREKMEQVSAILRKASLAIFNRYHDRTIKNRKKMGRTSAEGVT